MKKQFVLMVALVVFSVQSFCQQIDMSLIPYRKAAKWGYASPDGQIVITPRYDEANWFSEGYAAVKLGKKYGYINKAGNMVIPAKFTVAKSFRKGFMPNPAKAGGDSVLFAGASLQASGYEICINTKGARMPKCPAIAESSVPENNVPVKTVVTVKNYSIPNNNGLFDKIVDDYKISGSDETYYIAVKDNRYGIFNTKLETIVPFEYDGMKLVNTKNPYLEVNKAGMYGILNSMGQVKIAPENSQVLSVKGEGDRDYIIIKKDGKTYVKDADNNFVIAEGYADIIYDGMGGFIITGDNNMRGYYFSDKTTVAPKYTDIKLVNGTRYLQVKTFSGKLGYISSAGNEYFVE